MTTDLPRQTPDRMVRDTLRDPANLRDFLLDAFPREAAQLDIAAARPVEREMIGGDWRAREADLLFDVPYLGTPDQSSLVAVLIEHQSDTDPLMPLRTLLVVTAYWDRFWREWEAKPRPRPPLRLPPVLPVVLYTGDAPWGSNRELSQLLGPPAALHAFAPEWKPVFWNLAERNTAELLAGGAWLQLMTVMRVSGAEQSAFEAVLVEAIRRLNSIREAEHVRWHELLKAVLDYAVWRRPTPEQPGILEIAVRENPANHQEVKAMTMTIAQSWQLEGRLSQLREDVLHVLELRFGTVPSTLIDQLAATEEVSKLKAAHERSILVEKLSDFAL